MTMQVGGPRPQIAKEPATDYQYQQEKAMVG